MARNKHTTKFEIEKEEPVIEEVEIAEPEIIEEVVEPQIKTVKSGAHLRVRKFPVVADNIIRKLNPGEKVTVYEEVEGWARISDDQSEYVMTEFLV